jgi:hypothetical protein
MRAIALALLILIAGSGAARAEWSDPPEWYRQLSQTMRALLGPPPRDREVIKPPGNIDPKMVLVPPQTSGRMPIITPPERGKR